jgi:hypothetical protein
LSGATGAHPDGIWLGLPVHADAPWSSVRLPEPAMPSFYLVVTTLLRISLGLLDYASRFSDSDFLVVTPTMSNTVIDFDADAAKTISGFDGMR